MNKLEANLSLFIITFFAAIQYVFLGNVPESVSNFAFLTITNLIGFGMMLALFWGELFRINKKQILQGLILSGELFGFNLFVLLGTSGVSATVSSCVLSAYFVFIPLFSLVVFKKKPDKFSLMGIGVLLAGLFLIMKTDIAGMIGIHILYLVVADVFFAMYIMMTGHFTAKSNPSILAMGQMFFNAIFAFVFWLGESRLANTTMSLPSDAAFWGSVLFISIFIRGLYSVVQIYAQRYVNALDTSLIFSSEIVITMLMSPVLALLLGTEAEAITSWKLAGAITMTAGILIADSSFTTAVKRRLFH
ncbi:MAG: DMT family transporter, partial [Petrimonas sp.]|nr:DMT family transporter [Petrimonas sp.]